VPDLSWGHKGETHDIRERYSELGDAATADILTEIVRGVDKWLWFVEAHLPPRAALGAARG